MKSMHNFVSTCLRSLAAAALFLASAAFAAMPSVPGEPARGPKAIVQPTLHLATRNAPVSVLSPVADSELFAMRQANRRMQKRTVIGIVRDLSASPALPAARDLQWTAVPGGFAAQAAVRSPDAGAMRLAIDLAGAPASMQMVFFGSDDPGRLVGPVVAGAIGAGGKAWWSPITDGDTQTVEFFVPGSIDPAASSFRIAGAAHVFTTIASRFEKTTQDIGTSGSCNVDVKCSPLAGSQAFLDVRNSVAQMLFTDAAAGFIGLCTGQLLNDTDTSTQVPWFYSANHCFDNEQLPHKTASEMQTVARTLNTFWFFEAATCNARNVPNYSQLFNGAAFLYNNPGADSLFLRLNDTPPSGAFFAGWDANLVATGSSIVVIHHPHGDLKKVSQGTVVRYSAPQPSIPGGAISTFSEVQYSSGTTEGGSSGSGLFTFDGTQYRLRGALYGGGAACDALTDSDWYSQFDKVFASLSKYLTPAPDAIDYSDLWFNPAESGWGLNVIQHASRNIFAVWFTYAADGARTWFVIPGGTWTSPNTFTATMYSTSGPAASEGSFDPRRVTPTIVGSATLTFSDASHGTFAYTVNGVSGAKSITRQPF
ncbi:MAG: trypsin-like peptidase domain-containing protein [Usitatibacter sp.]